MFLQMYGTDKNGNLTRSESLFTATPLFYINMPDGEEAPVFDYKNFPFEIFTGAPLVIKKGKTIDRVAYYDLACCFDIETTTIDNEEKPYAFMYQWQYCIEDYVFMGKTWEEFQEFNEIITKAFNTNIYLTTEMVNNKPTKVLHGNSLVCYVFKLQFEFMFAQHFIGEVINPLMTDIFEPLIVPTEIGITYRCAYRLSNKSLDSFTKGFKHHKLAGDLDYNIKRVPVMDDVKNGLDDLSLAYCYNDVKGCCEALRDRLDKDKYNIASIPLTSTGYVRKDCQYSMRKNPHWRSKFLELALTPHLYELCRLAFRGGNTHANSRWVGRLMGLPELGGIGGLIRHKDETSAYPAQMLTKGFPLSPFKRIKNTESIIPKLDKISKKWCLLLKIRMIDIEYIGSCGVPYIARSKTITRTQDAPDIIEDNGRIFKAPYVLFACTEVDLAIILRDYSYSRIIIEEAYYSHKGLLPWELRRVIIDYYEKKTKLKGSHTPEDLYEYARAKENLNALYGMLCMRIDRVEFEYDHGTFTPIKKPLEEMINKFYEAESSFLPYQWALWVTSHARAALDKGCQICGQDLLYTDTDSCFYIGDHEAEFEQLNQELIAEAYEHNAVAYNKEGKAYPIGVWDDEDDCKLFKTLGAKKYLLSTDGESIESTISGVSKSIGKEYFTKYGFEAFTDETCIPVSGKVTAYYNNDKPHYIEVSGQRILTASNIALVNSSYTVHIKHDYKDFIRSIRKSLEIQYSNK